LHPFLDAQEATPRLSQLKPHMPYGRGVTARLSALFNGGAGYCAALRIGMFDFRNVRTRLIVRALSSGGSRHGKIVISALGASDAMSIEVGSGCDGVSSGRTRIGVRQLLINSRGTL
jgi:hypothetical protein